MLISEKRQTKLYSAIADKIMDVRIMLRKQDPNAPITIKADDLLFHLQFDIWREVKEVLNIDEHSN